MKNWYLSVCDLHLLKAWVIVPFSVKSIFESITKQSLFGQSQTWHYLMFVLRYSKILTSSKYYSSGVTAVIWERLLTNIMNWLNIELNDLLFAKCKWEEHVNFTTQ